MRQTALIVSFQCLHPLWPPLPQTYFELIFQPCATFTRFFAAVCEGYPVINSFDGAGHLFRLLIDNLQTRFSNSLKICNTEYHPPAYKWWKWVMHNYQCGLTSHTLIIMTSRAGTIYQYIDILQYWQSQYNINTSYYSIDISKYCDISQYINLFWRVLM